MLHDRAMHPRADLAQLREAMHKLVLWLMNDADG